MPKVLLGFSTYPLPFEKYLHIDGELDSPLLELLITLYLLNLPKFATWLGIRLPISISLESHLPFELLWLWTAHN